MNKRWPKYGQNANKNFGICINDNAFYSSSENTPPIGAIGYHRMGGDESLFLDVLKYN